MSPHSSISLVDMSPEVDPQGPCGEALPRPSSSFTLTGHHTSNPPSIPDSLTPNLSNKKMTKEEIDRKPWKYIGEL